MQKLVTGAKGVKKKKKRVGGQKSDDEMGMMEKPNFYQNISEAELKRIRASDPKLADQLKAEQQKAFKRQL